MSSSPTDRDDTADHGLVPQTVEVTLPRLGGQVLEAIVVAWEKHPGEWVERDEPLCIVSTDGLREMTVASAMAGNASADCGLFSTGIRIPPS